MSAVPITGAGVCCPLGRSPGAVFDAIAAGEDGFRPVDRFAVPGVREPVASCFTAAQLAELLAEAGEADPAVAFAVLAGRAALAGLDPTGVALVLGTSAGPADAHDRFDRARHADPDGARRVLREEGAFDGFAAHVAARLGLDGPRLMVSTACASGGHALGVGADLVRSGAAERVLVVASDAVHGSLFAGFQAAGALAPGRCAPFGAAFGMALGEGGAAVLLGGPGEPLAVVRGWGGSTDAWHATAPDPQGHGMARSLRSALADAGAEPWDVGYFNAHGTGTEANDSAEVLAIRAVLGDGVPVSSTKSQLGHAQGAAGLLEAIVTVEALRRQVLPPTLRALPARRIAPADPVPAARPHAFDVALSHSAAFGGTNVTIALARHGVGGASGREVYARVGGDVASATTGSRRMDPISVLLTAAMERACAGTHRPPDRVGVVVGVAGGPEESIRRFVDSRDAGSPSAAAFARMVFNAPAGAACLALQLRGPSVTLWTGPGAGAAAVLAGAAMLAEHRDLDAVVVAGADEAGGHTRDRERLGLLPCAPVAMAAALVLQVGSGDARLARTGWGGPGAWRELALRTCEAPPDRVVACGDAGSPWPDRPAARLDGHAPATDGVRASALAVGWIAAGEARTVLVLSASREAGSVALLWARPEGSDERRDP